ncbi:hypothetical protein AAON49_08345 [Pseudotenacibaculum sp. MALMAid0570]|uniref:hypothetical protein n=1 Tax=Pseudotenacibaculum sp. MALMAid0570 TaxID=3143938 RepID=UPI0032DFA8AA
MKLFIASLEKLTKIIRENTHIDPFSFNLINLLNESKEEVTQIQKETKGIQLVEIDEFWDLTEEIYKKLMLRTIETDLSTFFKQLQKNPPSSHIEMRYQLFPWQLFSLTFDHIKKEFPLNAEYAESQIQQLLDLFQIKDSNWINDLYDFDYKFNFQSQIEQLFRELLFSCWKEIKTKTNSKITASIQEINGGSYVYDLDTRNKKK